MGESSNRLEWRKCESSGCVEVAAAGDEVFIRSSREPDGPRITVTKREWEEFVAGVRAGHFDFA